MSVGDLELLDGVQVPLGGPRALTVTRTLPHRDRRMVGAWCFLDAYGPAPVSGPGMRVPPHPHVGLQTVSWLHGGRVLHRDSLGSEQLVEPGALSLMTAGAGIAHSEESVRAPTTPTEWTLRTQHAGRVAAEVSTDEGVIPGAGPLHGVQLWVALPDADRHGPPRFEHHGDLPVLVDGGARVTVILGNLAGATSAARVHSPIVGAELALAAGARLRLPLDPAFEHAVLAVDGEATVADAALVAGPLLYLGTGRRVLDVEAAAPAVLLLLGGEPFEEELVMWWNFVARSHDEIAQARDDWASGVGRFGVVRGFDGDPLPAPALPTIRLRPRPRRPRH